ncbi:hypothetical protein JOD55_000538 [Arcanobacterium pluranimalium]|nr:hypothetical protein [Arcanobacterium pluranimalium]
MAEWKLRRALHDSPTTKPVSGWIDAEMDALTDDYAAFVQERLRDVHQECADPQVLIEQRLDFSHVVPGGFGTGNCVIIAELRLQIIDLKYGQGVMVEAEHNPQLMLYALGALNAFGSLYDISEVAVTIFQPRRSNVSTWTIPVAKLEAWTEQVVKPRAALAARGDGEFAPGEWCRFCKLVPTCRTRAETNLVLAQHELAPPAELTDAEIAQVLAQLPDLKAWAADVEAHALSLAVNQGKTWPRFKLVEGRSVRNTPTSPLSSRRLRQPVSTCGIASSRPSPRWRSSWVRNGSPNCSGIWWPNLPVSPPSFLNQTNGQHWKSSKRQANSLQFQRSNQ